MIRYYKHYHGTGFGKASTAAVRNFRCPIKTIMQGDANPKSRRTQDAQTESTPPPPPADTTDVHAHVAHSDAEEDVCACRSAVEMRQVHGHRIMAYTSLFSIRATSARASGRTEKKIAE